MEMRKSTRLTNVYNQIAKAKSETNREHFEPTMRDFAQQYNVYPLKARAFNMSFYSDLLS